MTRQNGHVRGAIARSFGRTLRVSRILCFLNLLYAVKTFLESNHKLTEHLFPVLNGHRPALGDVA